MNLFAWVDRDGSGKISREELQEATLGSNKEEEKATDGDLRYASIP